MMKYIGNDYEGCEPYTDELEYGLGSLYPMPGGLRENVEHFLGKEQVVRQVEASMRHMNICVPMQNVFSRIKNFRLW